MLTVSGQDNQYCVKMRLFEGIHGVKDSKTDFLTIGRDLWPEI